MELKLFKFTPEGLAHLPQFNNHVGFYALATGKWTRPSFNAFVYVAKRPIATWPNRSSIGFRTAVFADQRLLLCDAERYHAKQRAASRDSPRDSATPIWIEIT